MSCKLGATSSQSRLVQARSQLTSKLSLRAGQDSSRGPGPKGGRRGGTECCGLVVPNVSDPAGTAAQAARVADSCRRFRIDRAAQSTVLHRQAVEAGDWSVLRRAVRCSNGANGGGG